MFSFLPPIPLRYARKDNNLISTGTDELSEVILYVQDMNLQVAFYRDILGLSVKEPQGVKDFRDFYSVVLNAGSCSLTLHAGGKKRISDDAPKLVFRVANIHASRYDFIEKDVQMGEVYAPTPGILISEGKDPEGNAFAIEHRSEASASQIRPAASATRREPAFPYVSANSWRGRCIGLLRHNKFLIAAEILCVTALIELLSFLGLVPLISILLVVMAFLWLRGTNWSVLGLHSPSSKRLTIILGLVFGVIFAILQMDAIAPIVEHFVHVTHLQQPLPVPSSGISPKGNILFLISSLISSWTSAGFVEEMIFRGYLMNRLADLFGHKFWGWTIALLLQAAIFGSAHAYEGLDGMITVGIYGLLIGLLYFATNRNLWVCAITHALTDTISFLFIFLGL